MYICQGTCTYVALISRLSPSSVHYCVTFDPPSATHVLIWQEPWFICKHVSPFTSRSYVCMYYIYIHTCVSPPPLMMCVSSVLSLGGCGYVLLLLRVWVRLSSKAPSPSLILQETPSLICGYMYIIPFDIIT